MRKLFPLFVVASLFSGVVLSVNAAEVKTITGIAQCAKCSLKEAPKCTNVVAVKEGDKTVFYYLADNELSKDAHRSYGFCTAKKDDGPKVTVKGEVEEKDGKMVITATEIEDAK